MEERNKEETDKRSIRRKKRMKSQMAAYVTLFLIILIIAGGGIATYILLNNQRQPVSHSDNQIEEHLDNLTNNEDEIVTPDPETVVPELTPEEKLDDIIDAAIEAMPLEDKVAGLFIVTPEGLTGKDKVTQAGETTQAALNQYAVGGIIYFDSNMRSEEKFLEMVQNTVAFSKYPLFLASDEEGGKISRLTEAGLASKTDSAGNIGATNDPTNAYNAGAGIAVSMNKYGLNLDLAPVADITVVDNSAIGDRSYGSDSTVAGSMVSSMVTALQENGVSACLKHFPGIGSTVQDTHDGMASTERTIEEFRANEFTVFKAGIDAGADFVMIGHISAPGLTGDNTPCSLSQTVVTDMLRGELGFEGVVISDALNMTSITDYYTSEQAAILALKAGCDMILMPEDFEEAYQGVLAAVENGTISEERINDSLKRIYRIKYADRLEE